MKGPCEQCMSTPVYSNDGRNEHCEQHMPMPFHPDVQGQDPCEQCISTPVHLDVRRKQTAEQDDHSCLEVPDMSNTEFTLHGGEAKYFQKMIEPKIRVSLR